MTYTRDQTRTGRCDAMVDGDYVRLELDEVTTLTSRLTDGEFPPYQTLIPKNDNVIAEFGPSLSADLKRLAKLGTATSTRVIKFRPCNGGIELSATDGTDTDATICEGTMHIPEIGLNPAYLPDMIDGMLNLQLHGIDHLKPVSLRDRPAHLGANVDRIRLLMPTRI